jgi:acyl-CoA dehydrogenase
MTVTALRTAAPATATPSEALFNPKTCTFAEFDPETQRLFKVVVDFFETRGKKVLKEQDRDLIWYSDFLEVIKNERIFATFLTPAALADGDAHKRWDTGRNAMLSKILGFYGMAYWYVWQVTILGLGPIWQSSNVDAKKRAAALLESGEIFAFGLSEKDHGADVYSTDMVLTPGEEGSFSATGGKHYIGNGNLARMVSVFGRRSDKPVLDSADFERHANEDEFDGYVFFAADSQHPAYKLGRNVVDAQMYVAAFDLEDYPVKAEDILHTGKSAFHAAINTVNVGKFNLGFGAIGACEHSYHEAVTHAENRILFGQRVTEFPQVRRMLADAYARLIAMKLYSERAIDYMRTASPDDRRYLLFNSIEKMTVTRQGESVMIALWDTIAARAFENDMYFPMAILGVSGLPRLEGTVHVNMALALKFMQNYMFNPADAGLALLRYLPGNSSPILSKALRKSSRAATPLLSRGVSQLRSELSRATFEPVPTRRDTADDEFLFRQGPSRGLSKVRFHDWRPVFEAFSHVPNVGVFLEQAEGLQTLLATATPTAEQQKDVDFLFSIGEMFTLIPYAQLVLEQAQIAGTSTDVLDQIFDVLVRDFSAHAVTLNGKPNATKAQQTQGRNLIRRPIADEARFGRVVTLARAVAGSYEMNP